MEDTPLLPRVQSNIANMRRLSYVASAICCLLSASFTVFSLYTVAFENKLEYTPLEVNYVSITAEMGLYLCVPLLGYIADAYRLSYIGALGCVGYLVGYGGCAWVVRTHQPWPLMALFFGIVGVGCSATFISSLVNCARLFPDTALLAISLPTTLYGFSSLIYAKLIGLYLNADGDLDALFIKLAVGMFVIGILATLAPVWGRVDKSAEMVAVQESEDVPDEFVVKRFFCDPKTVLFLLSFVLVSGPLEMFQNNVGLIVKNSGGTTAQVAHQVSLFTGFSTATRLAAGALIDAFNWRPSWMLMGMLALLAVADFGFSQNWLCLSIISSISGISYGGSFTLYPLVVSQVWGINEFATYWGMFILGPAIGMLIFGLEFGHDVQKSASVNFTFMLCALVAIVSFIIVSRLKFHKSYD